MRLHSRARNTPFEGRKLSSRPAHTLLRAGLSEAGYRTAETIREIHAHGSEAARALFGLLDSPHTPQRVLLPTELVIRQSTVGGSLQ